MLRAPQEVTSELGGRRFKLNEESAQKCGDTHVKYDVKPKNKRDDTNIYVIISESVDRGERRTVVSFPRGGV